MRFQPGGLLEGDRIVGRLGGYRVELDNLGRKHTSVVLHADHLPRNIHCCARTWGDRISDDPLRIGDDPFDRTVRVAGPAVQVQARLTARARAVVAAAIGTPSRPAATVVVTGGRVTYDAEYHVEPAARLEAVVQRLADIADALALDGDVAEQLGRNALCLDEPEAVRWRNLEALIHHYPKTGAAESACRALIEGVDPALRLLATGQRRLAPDGRRVLRGIVGDRGLPDALRVRALRIIDGTDDQGAAASDRGPHLAGDPLEDLLSAIVRDPSSAVRQAVAESLARRENGEPSLLLCLAEDPSPSVAAAALRGLTRVFDRPPPRLNDTLIAALRRPSYAVRLAAVEALSIAGTEAAVEPVRAVLRASFFDQRLRQAARSAIRAIQVRTRPSGAGHLSLVLEDDGRGMLSASEHGRLSEAPTTAR